MVVASPEMYFQIRRLENYMSPAKTIVAVVLQAKPKNHVKTVLISSQNFASFSSSFSSPFCSLESELLILVTQAPWLVCEREDGPHP